MKSMILAVDSNGGIGYKGGLPWPRIAEDMAWFKHVTMQHKRCIMGRKTWESVGKLEGRECHIVTRYPELIDVSIAGVHSFPPTLEDGDIVIGGASLYGYYADQVDVVFLTEVNGTYDYDVRVELDYLLKDQLHRGRMTTKDNHVFNVYVRRWTLAEDLGRHSKNVDKAVDMLDTSIVLRAAQDGNPAPELAPSVSNPAHYTQGGIETIEAIGAITTGYTGEDAFCAGNVVKYIARAPFKGNKKEDLKKALWYLNRLIDGGGNDC